MPSYKPRSPHLITFFSSFHHLLFLTLSLFLRRHLRETFTTIPFPHRRRTFQSNTRQMKPFLLTILIITRNHITKRNLSTETINLRVFVGGNLIHTGIPSECRSSFSLLPCAGAA